MISKMKEAIKKNKKIYMLILWIKVLTCGIYYSLFLYLFRIFPINNNKIMIISYYGKGYGDMGKSIIQELKKTKTKYNIYWGVKPKYLNTIPSYIFSVKYNSPLFLYHLATSRVWINNTRFEYGIIKRKKQFYIQTWHGGLGLKKIEKEAGDLPSTYIAQAKRDSKMINVMISNCEYRTKQYLNNFWYSGKVLEYGLPRNDIFFKKTDLSLIRKKLKIDGNDLIILYAPTVRSYKFNYLQIDFENIVNLYKEKYNKNVKVLIRIHPNICDNTSIIETKNIINVSTYPDVYELMKITDILISDYSSIIFDFLYTNNPVYLFAPDYNEYVKERGMNFKYNELPFSISYDYTDLEKNIITKDHLKHDDQLKKFLENVKLVDDGNSSRKICQLIKLIVEKGVDVDEV